MALSENASAACAETSTEASELVSDEDTDTDHLYSETTSIQRPLGLVPIVVLPLLRDHLYSKTTFKRGHLIQVSLYV